jgi:hypothetical protein
MTKFYRSSESGTEELVLTPRATDVETVADAIDLARYQHPECPRERPRPFSEANRSDREYATRLARAALAAAQAVAPEWKCKAQWTADPPQDCNWPFCGCDPYADKVLSAVDESGFAIVDTGTAKDAATAPAPWPTEEQDVRSQRRPIRRQ